MITNELALRNAWIAVLDRLDVSGEGSTILGGPLAERFGASVPFRTVDEVAGLVSLGSGPILDAEANVVESGLEDASVDAVVMIDAWRTPSELADVVDEAKRISKPGATTWLGSLDIERLVHATPSARLSALFYSVYGPAMDLPATIGTNPMAIDLALQRAGFGALESWPTDLPIAAFSTIDEYVDAVASGMWPGVGALSLPEWLSLEAEIRAMLETQASPYIEHQPWLLVAGKKPG